MTPTDAPAETETKGPKPRAVRARRLRRAMTKPELKLRLALRNRGCAGFKFRRQVPMGPYFLDFFDASCKLVVEVDGRSHDDRGLHDAARQRELARRGLTVLRVSNDEVLEDLEAITATIRRIEAKGAAPR